MAPPVRRGISGDVKERERSGRLRRRSRRTGHFEYHVTLPGETDEEHIDATLHDGVLTVRVPKAEQAKPRRIEVRAASTEHPLCCRLVREEVCR